VVKLVLAYTRPTFRIKGIKCKISKYRLAGEKIKKLTAQIKRPYMSWTKVLSADALSPDSRQVVKVGNRDILLLNHQGQLYAVENACPHLKLPLKKGKITEDGAIVCPWHRSAFDLRTGEVKKWVTWPPLVGKAMSIVSQQKALPVFPVRVEDGSIWIEVEQ
jgi:nitrite reductase/ring-hydroxylating ferredoxin subunit